MAKKPTTKTGPSIGAEGLLLVGRIAHGLAPEIRGASGLASALLALYGHKLEEAEAEYHRLGHSCSDDAGAAYRRQGCRTHELRGLVAILTTLADTLEPACGSVDRLAELTRRCKGAAQ